jgi:RHS repeat-associated protein
LRSHRPSDGPPPGLEGREALPPGIARQETPPPGLGGPARGRGQGLETAPGQQREPQSAQSEQPEARQILVDVRTNADRAAVTGQAQSSVSSGELPGEFLYFFHPDHLGSTSYVTDDKGAVYEHVQYFPFGETWVQEGQPSQRIPYLFTSKELDEETGLYYFGARYYDPRTSLWVSADPAMDKFLPELRTLLQAERQLQSQAVAHAPSLLVSVYHPEQDLPAGGGVYSSLNLSMYAYAKLNPLRVIDPDGRAGHSAEPLLSGAAASVPGAKTTVAFAHYLSGSGEPRSVPVGSVTSGIKPSSFEKVKSLLGEGKIGTYNVSATQSLQTSGEAAAFIGNAEFKLEGTLTIGAVGQFSFEGTISGGEPDVYNFNPSTHRGVLGELSTTIGRALGDLFGGKGFKIEITGSQSIREGQP